MQKYGSNCNYTFFEILAKCNAFASVILSSIKN